MRSFKDIDIKPIDDYFPSDVSCACGGIESNTCSQEGVHNHIKFPAFSCVPNENEVDLDFYQEVDNILIPRRHWILCAKITRNLTDFRPRMEIQTCFGERLRLHFYLEDAQSSPEYFEWSQMKKGNTLLLLYPVQHDFMDGSQGIRLDSTLTCTILPFKLEVFDKIYKKIADTKPRCHTCSKEKSIGDKYFKCGSCKIARYCSRECQAKDWVVMHKVSCLYMKRINTLVIAEYENFTDFMTWDS